MYGVVNLGPISVSIATRSRVLARALAREGNRPPFGDGCAFSGLELCPAGKGWTEAPLA